MIVKQYYETRKDGVNLYITFSNKNKYIIQNETGVKYSEAIDVENANYTYTEIDEDIKYEDIEY